MFHSVVLFTDVESTTQLTKTTRSASSPLPSEASTANDGTETVTLDPEPQPRNPSPIYDISSSGLVSTTAGMITSFITFVR